MPQERQALIYMSLGIVLYTLNDTIFKVLTESFSVPQILCVRSFCAFLMMLPFLRRLSFQEIVRPPKASLHLLRNLLAAASVLFTGLALSGIQISSVISVLYISPLLIAILAHLILGEKVAPHILASIGLGLVGVFVMMMPGSELLSIHGLYALLATLLYSLSFVIGRLLSDTKPQLILFHYALVCCGLGAVASSFDVPTLTPQDGLIFCASALIHTCAFFLILKALALCDANRLGVVEYTSLIWAVLFGAVVFGDIPDVRIVIGALILVLSHVLNLRHRAPTEGPLR